MFDLAALVDEFLEYCEIEKNLSLLTIRDYRHYLKHFVAWQAENSPVSQPSDMTRTTRVARSNARRSLGIESIWRISGG